MSPLLTGSKTARNNAAVFDTLYVAQYVSAENAEGMKTEMRYLSSLTR
jgi:hypothetical protein